jgi:hypothetical protein
MKKMILLVCAAVAAMSVKAGTGTESASGSFSKEEDDKVSVSVKYHISLPAATDDAMKAVRKAVLAAAFGGLGYGPAKLPDTDSLTDAAKTFMEAEKKIPADVIPYRREFSVTVKTGEEKGGCLAVAVDGYDNNGGNGCHSFARRFLFDAATGKRVTEADFMKPGAFSKWAEAVRAKYKADDKDHWKLWEVKEYPHDFTVETDGIRWKWPAYTLGPGCDGLPETFFSWDELAPLADDTALAKLKAAAGAKRKN